MNNLSGVHIGVGAPLSGASRSMGIEMSQAIEMAVEDANAESGALGFTFQSEVADDASEPGRAEVIARRFCSESRVLGIVGHYNSDASLAAATVYRDAGLAMITPIASNPDLTERGLHNVFRFTNRDDRTAMAMARFLYTNRGKARAAVVESRSAYGRSMGERFMEAFRAVGGTVTARYDVDIGQREFDRLIRELGPGFDVLFYGGTFEGAYVLTTMRSAGFNQLFAAGDGCWDTTNFLEPAGLSATEGEGVLVLAATPEIGFVPRSAEFAARYRSRFGPITNYAVNSYDAASTLIQAINACAENTGRIPSREDVLRSLRSLRHHGIAYPKPTTWDAKGDNLAAVTALYDVVDRSFHQLAVID